MNRTHITRVVIIVSFLALILFFAAAYLYSQNAGEWASSTILSIPPNSKFVQDYYYNEYGYNHRLFIYTSQGLIQDIRNWYSKELAMSPIDGKLSEADSRYCSLNVSVENIPHYKLLFTTAFITLNPNVGRYSKIPDCFSVCIYKTLSNHDYPVLIDTTLNVPENSSIVVLNTCWPDW